MTENEEIMERYDKLDLYSKNIIVECVSKLKVINDECREQTRKEIYYLSEQKADLIMYAIKVLEKFNRVGGVNNEERLKLLNLIEEGKYFCMD